MKNYKPQYNNFQNINIDSNLNKSNKNILNKEY